MAGKGQFSCGAKGCSKTDSLETYEVPFKYVEAGSEKYALVKVGCLTAVCQHRWLRQSQDIQLVHS